tara:strand:+ start:15849 stop:16412 length:564 start_codon:yes stop_codon:yes gene_type:complete
MEPEVEEEKTSGFLTNRQKEFAKLIVDGIYSNAECARRAGYSQKVAVKYAHKLLNGKDFPLVPEHIAELRQERERKYGVTLIGQLKRLSDLSHNAESEGQFSAAINAEKIRASLGGLTVDRRENQHIHSYDQLTREEIIAQLGQLRDEHPAAFVEGEYEVVEHGDTREEPLEQIEDQTSERNAQDAG